MNVSLMLSTAETAMEKVYLQALSELDENATEKDIRDYYQRVKRVAAMHTRPQTINLSLPPLDGDEVVVSHSHFKICPVPRTKATIA